MADRLDVFLAEDVVQVQVDVGTAGGADVNAADVAPPDADDADDADARGVQVRLQQTGHRLNRLFP